MSNLAWNRAVSNLFGEWRLLFAGKHATKSLMFRTLFFGFCVGFFSCVIFLSAVHKASEKRRQQAFAQQEVLYQSSGEAMLPLEKEKQIFSAFLANLEKAERMAADWERQNHRDGLVFLSAQAKYALPTDVEELLQCKIEDPTAIFPKCVGEHFSFYDFLCNENYCIWTFCRKGSAPHSCIYSGAGSLTRGSFRWDHSINVLFPQSVPLAKWVEESHGWKVYGVE